MKETKKWVKMTRAEEAALNQKQRDKYRQSQYGLSPAAFEALLHGQGDVCAICRKANWNGKGPNVDHDHITGKVRGLLCPKCNTALGMAEDDLQRLRAMVAYLEEAELEMRG